MKDNSIIAELKKKKPTFLEPNVHNNKLSTTYFEEASTK